MSTTLPADRLNVLLTIRAGKHAAEAAAKAVDSAEMGALETAEHLATEAAHAALMAKAAAHKARTGEDRAPADDVTLRHVDFRWLLALAESNPAADPEFTARMHAIRTGSTSSPV